jgi:Protein of unknown function (DUF3987)
MSDKPTTYIGDLAKLPNALAPLIERPQWCVWRWTQKPDGTWQKPPFQARDPERHASTKGGETWSDYATALATVQAGHADGLTYILTNQDPFAAADLDHCRDVHGSIDVWAQNLLEQALHTYAEATVSGTGLRIWGTAGGGVLDRKFKLSTDGDGPALELFRHTHKALTISGWDLRQGRALGNIDRLLNGAVPWAQRRRAAIAPTPVARSNGGGAGLPYTIDEIEQIVRNGAPDGANRSDLFHAIVGHYHGCGWSAEEIVAHFEPHLLGIGERFIAEGRLVTEVIRSLGKYVGYAWTSDAINAHLRQFTDGSIGGHLVAEGRLALEGATASRPAPVTFVSVAESAGMTATAELEAESEPPWEEPEAEPAARPTSEPEAEPEWDDDGDGLDDELDDDTMDRGASAPQQQQLRGREREPIHSWDDPDRSLLDDRRGDLPEFPLETLSGPIQDWVRRTADITGVTPAHVAVPLLAMAAATVGTARRVQATPSWSEPMTDWFAVIGYSGTGKTPGLDASKRALDVADRDPGRRLWLEEWRRKHTTKREIAKQAYKLWRKDVENALKEGDEVPLQPANSIDPGPFVEPRLYVTDSTVERIGALLRARPQGGFCIKDELAELFANMGRYTRGQDNQFWLQCWNGNAHVVERMQRSLRIRYLLVGLFGGFQPDKFAQAFEGPSDGMYARFCFSWPPEPAHRPLSGQAADIEPELVHAFERLDALGGRDPDVFEPAYIPLSAEALALFEELRAFAAASKARLDGRAREWMAKMQAHTLRLSGTLAYLAWGMTGGPEPTEIAASVMRSAIILVRDYFWPHSREALHLIGLTEHDADARRVLRWIKVEERIEVSREEVRRRALGKRLDAEGTQDVLDRLVRAGWLREKRIPSPGRTAVRWEVCPQLAGDDHV